MIEPVPKPMRDGRRRGGASAGWAQALRYPKMAARWSPTLEVELDVE